MRHEHVHLVVQGPADLVLGGSNAVFLTEGRLTARLTDRQGLGFAVHTARSTVVDQGTEFGVDVAPGGDEKVHVFQGKVQFQVATAEGDLMPPTDLIEDEGARVTADAANVFLTNDTGDSFARSVDQSGRDRHTVAYWRFEDHPVGMLVSDTSKNAKVVRGTSDSSGNGNDLFAFSTATGPRFSGDVPARALPQSGRSNRGSLDNTAVPGSDVLTRDLYTRSRFSHASPLDIQRISPLERTVEASVKLARLGRGAQTFLGRDSDGAPVSRFPARLALQINADDRFAVRFIDGDERLHEAIAARLSIEMNHWYHAAATSDGRDLKLHVDCQDGQGYQLQAAVGLPNKGHTALGKVGDSGGWTVGRGLAREGRAGEWFQGWIDEVRISDVARRPAEFLFMHGPTTAERSALLTRERELSVR